MTRNDKAREVALKVIRGGYVLDRYALDRVTVPDYGEVQWAADGRAYVEALIEVPAAMLREERADG